VSKITIWTSTIAATIALSFVAPDARAGSIFLTGHDSDFHAAVPPDSDGEEHHNDALGAQHLNQIAIDYILDPRFNSFFADGIERFLFVEANAEDANFPYSPLLGKQGLLASGFVEGVDFDQRGADGLPAALALLGKAYSGIVVASDCGGSLRQAELDILNSHSAAIMSFLNDGGGLFAMAESNLCGPPDDPTNGITPNGGHFDFLPFVTSSTLSFAEDDPAFDIQVTAYARALGLTLADVDGNFAHNVFGGSFGMNVIDSVVVDGVRVPLSLATRRPITPDGVPEPPSAMLIGVGLALGAARIRRMWR
jgi:hypothetical protein